MERPSSKYGDYYRSPSPQKVPAGSNKYPIPPPPKPPEASMGINADTKTSTSGGKKRLYTKKWKGIPLVPVLIFVIILAIAGGYILINRGKNEAQDLAKQLSVTVDLPTDETPSVAEVKDVSKLTDQPFYNLAQNGDKVLVYQKSGKALLYRPSTGKVIEYTPVNISPQ